MAFCCEKFKMKTDKFDFIQDADNLYRTDQYIVNQHISFCHSPNGGNLIMSTDTYYLRTPKRDGEYEKIMCGKRNKDGKRMKSAMFTRKYVD